MEDIVIIITEAKVRNCLAHHVARVERRREWIAPTGILASLVAALATTALPARWLDFFVLATAVTVGWLLVALARLRGSGDAAVEAILDEMKYGPPRIPRLRRVLTVDPARDLIEEVTIEP